MALVVTAWLTRHRPAPGSASVLMPTRMTFIRDPLMAAAGDRRVPSSSSRKLLVAHRGASAYAPEHTLAAYRLALEQRADFVEQDLAHDARRRARLPARSDARPHDRRRAGLPRSLSRRQRRAALVRRRLHARRDQAARRRRVVRSDGSPASACRRSRKPSTWCAARPASSRSSRRLASIAIAAWTWRRSSSPRCGRNGPRPQGRRSGDAADPAVVRRGRAAGARARPAVARSHVPPRRARRRAVAHRPRACERSRRLPRGIGPAKLLIDTDATLVPRAHARGLTVIPYTFRVVAHPDASLRCARRWRTSSPSPASTGCSPTTPICFRAELQLRSRSVACSAYGSADSR